MAGLGRKVFLANEVLSAANVNGYLMDQTVMVFAGTAARSSAIGTASEGMITYLTDNNSIEFFDGSNWEAMQNAGTSVSSAFTATRANANSKIYATGSSAYAITIPDILAVDQTIEIYRDSSGTVSIVAGTGVTSWAGAGTAGTAIAFKIDQQYNGAAVTKVAANSYRVIGKIAV